MKSIDGDLLQLAKNGYFDIIVHGCNCFHTMGAGIARQVKNIFPEAYLVDVSETMKGDKKKLGTISYVNLKNTFGNPLVIVNGYTQYSIYKNEKRIAVDYGAIRSVFEIIREHFLIDNPKLKIGFPRIGAGLAGGDWNRISKIIDKELKGYDYTLVNYKK